MKAKVRPEGFEMVKQQLQFWEHTVDFYKVCLKDSRKNLAQTEKALLKLQKRYAEK